MVDDFNRRPSGGWLAGSGQQAPGAGMVRAAALDVPSALSLLA